ncbi:MAG: PLP-dependent aminotransferase family protein [Deltaproteobacteria bacterium]|nr:PLP-dependent aminotransferase family protein [Deltaproteobacteria bacterium]
MPFEKLLAHRTRHMSRSAIREILKVASQPGMISLAGGVPTPASFPLDLIGDLSGLVIQKYADRAFQYDLTEGFMPLRQALAAHLSGRDIHVPGETILITSGSQGVLDAAGKILISPGDTVGVESPTYLGALQAFSPYEPHYTPIPCDKEGVIPEALAPLLAKGRMKFIYLVPTFQNPSGRTLPLARRRAIAALIERYDTLLIEDDPYCDLRYEGHALPPIKSLAPDHVVYVSTLSKVFAPGLRIGYCVAPEPIRNWLVLVKQGVDLHTSTFNQALATEYLEGGHLQRHLPRLLDLYRPKQQAMLEALRRHLPAGFEWSRPEGGMFVWVEGPEGTNMADIYQAAVRRQVAFVPGHFFFPQSGEGLNTMRLNFTMPGTVEIDHAIHILGDILRDHRDRSIRVRGKRRAGECVPC